MHFNNTLVYAISTTHNIPPQIEIHNSIIQEYSFGDRTPMINYFFLLCILFFPIVKVIYLINTKQSIIENFQCVKFTEINFICTTTLIINTIGNIIAISIYPNINEQACLFIIGYGNYIVQLCDNSIFYFAYKSLHKKTITSKFTYLCLLYIFVFMTLSWLPIYVIVPYVNNTKSNLFVKIYVDNGLTITTYANILYNLYFSLEFIKIIYFYHKNNKNISQITYTVSVKCIIHCFSSNIGLLIFNYYEVNSIDGSLIYIFILTLSMNILFNFNITQKMNGLYKKAIYIINSIHYGENIPYSVTKTRINGLVAKGLYPPHMADEYDKQKDYLDENIDKKVMLTITSFKNEVFEIL